MRCASALTEKIGENYSFEIRIENNGTTYKPAGKHCADAEALCKTIAGNLNAKAGAEAAGFIVLDPATEQKKLVRLEDSFDDYIADAFKRNALEAREQAIGEHQNFPREVRASNGRIGLETQAM